jgi:hypothetical protein
MPWFGDKGPIPVGRRSGLGRGWTWSSEPPKPERGGGWWWPWVVGAAAIVAGVVCLTLACILGGRDGGPSVEEEGVLPYAAIAGSVSVALFDGQPAAAIIFEGKCDAYLVAKGWDSPPRLADGEYFFQVTNASGSALLSADEVRFRQFRVTNGAIEGVSGEWGHAVGIDRLSGAATVQLCPFVDSPDSSGMYQVWVTRVEDFQGDVEAVDSPAGDSHGFLAARSARAPFAVSPGR